MSGPATSGTTPHLSLPYPGENDNADGPQGFLNLATKLDNDAVATQDVAANRPVSTTGTPGVYGRWFKATDTGLISRDYGTGWDAINQVDAAPSVGSWRTLGTGANQAAAGNDSRFGSKTRQSHSFTMSDQTSPTGTILGSFFIDPASGETVTLVEVVIHCVTVGSTPSVLKVRYDHGSHGTLSDVAGLTSLTPSTTATIVTASGGPLPLSSLDRICVVVVTAGNSLGVTVDIKTEHSS